MGKILKISMAMGGGVSLGTFSGAALTESLKLLLLFGQDEYGEKYESIELDGMSGASAGAISLGIMLRALLDYKSILKKLNISERNLEKKVVKLYGQTTYNKLPRTKQKQLIALQAAQELQETIWVKELNIKDLIGVDSDLSSNQTISLLSRKLLKELVNRYIRIGENEKVDFNDIQVVNKNRFIMAASLSNLAPVKSPYVLKKFNEIKVNSNSNFKLVENLMQSVSSYNHKEIRVLDFVFNEEKVSTTDERWIKFTISPNEKSEPTEFDLGKNESWDILASTVMACGAFPIAFEPVLLKRYKKEFGENGWPEKFNILTNNVNKAAIKNSYIDKKNDSNGTELDYESFNFPYVDGGTFNNEPIKEAFKIANYLDYHDPRSKDHDYDRIILFVDPIVSENDPKFQISAYCDIKISKEKDTNVKYEKNSQISKLLGLGTNLISMLQHQGSVKEEHKIDDYVENLELNKSLLEYLLKSKISTDNSKLLKHSIKKIRKALSHSHISYGTRSYSEYLGHKLVEICKSNTENSPFSVLCNKDYSSNELKELVSKIISYINIDAKNIDSFLPHNKISGVLKEIRDDSSIAPITELNPSDIKNDILKLILIVLVEASIGTQGKDDKAIRVAITPFDMLHCNDTVRLPGVEIAAFAGFTSDSVNNYSMSGKYAFEYGRLCAVVALGRNDFRAYYNKVIKSNMKSSKSTNSSLSFIPKNLAKSLTKDIKKEILLKDFYNDYNSYGDDVSDRMFKYGLPRILYIFHSSSLGKRLKGIGKIIVYGLAAGIDGGIGGFYSIKNILNKKNSSSNLIKAKAIEFGMKSDFKESIITKKLTPIDVKIRFRRNVLPSINRPRYLSILAINSKGETIKIKPIVESIQGSKEFYMKFQLYKEISYMNNQSCDESKSDKEIHLFAKSKKKISLIDPNLVNQALDFTDEIRTLIIKTSILKKHNYKIFEMVKGQKSTDIKSIFNNNSKSLHYSLLYSEYHISPTLEIDMTSDNHQFIFVEDTLALSLDF